MQIPYLCGLGGITKMTKITSTYLFLSHHHTESFMIACLLFHNNADLMCQFNLFAHFNAYWRNMYPTAAMALFGRASLSDSSALLLDSLME